MRSALAESWISLLVMCPTALLLNCRRSEKRGQSKNTVVSELIEHRKAPEAQALAQAIDPIRLLYFYSGPFYPLFPIAPLFSDYPPFLLLLPLSPLLEHF